MLGRHGIMVEVNASPTTDYWLTIQPEKIESYSKRGYLLMKEGDAHLLVIRDIHFTVDLTEEQAVTWSGNDNLALSEFLHPLVDGITHVRFMLNASSDNLEAV